MSYKSVIIKTLGTIFLFAGAPRDSDAGISIEGCGSGKHSHCSTTELLNLKAEANKRYALTHELGAGIGEPDDTYTDISGNTLYTPVTSGGMWGTLKDYLENEIDRELDMTEGSPDRQIFDGFYIRTREMNFGRWIDPDVIQEDEIILIPVYENEFLHTVRYDDGLDVTMIGRKGHTLLVGD